MTETLLRETEQFLHQQIPITLAMGVQLEHYDGNQLILTAPLEPNHNHLGTAFGGSLSALATLAGYSLLWLLLGDRQAHIVVKSSSICYLHPVTGGIRVICQKPPEAAVQDFRRAYASKGRARLQLQATVEEDQKVCVTFTGEFVAIK